MSKFGVILLLDQAVSRGLVAYSRKLSEAFPAYMTLGPDAPPHITLMHAECDSSAAEKWWGGCKRLGSTLRAERAGLVFEHIGVGDEYVPEGGFSCGVPVIRSSILSRAHEAVLRGAEEAGARPLGAVGESFRPHVTLTIFPAFPDGPVPFDAEVTSGAVEGRLALGELGAFGTFPRIVDRL